MSRLLWTKFSGEDCRSLTVYLLIVVCACALPISYVDTQLVGPPGPPGDKGATGATGPVGYTGPVGELGKKGDTGSAGASGAAGPRGPPGVIGLPGARGHDGYSGVIGATGYTGATGATGVIGPDDEPAVDLPAENCSGPVGPPGPPGPPGDTGISGPSGVPGFIGDTGSDGDTGPTGMAYSGPSGSGETGQQGAQGPVGDTGFTGGTGLTGVIGEAGMVGVQGRRRIRRQSVGCPGPKGPTGATGATGSRGVDGLRGATGQPGRRGATGLAGRDGGGEIGPMGLMGVVGDSGSVGATGATGLRGQHGLMGSTGAVGQPRLVNPPQVTGLWPHYGPVSGGTRLTVTGSWLNRTRLRAIHYGHEYRSIIDAESHSVALFDTLNIYTPRVSNSLSGLQLPLTLEYVDQLFIETTFVFSFQRDPLVTDVRPREHLVTGGTKVTVFGTNLNASLTQQLLVNVTWIPRNSVTSSTTTSLIVSCSSVAEHSMTCIMPSLINSTSADGNTSASTVAPQNSSAVASFVNPSASISRADVYIGVQMDGYRQDLGATLSGLAFQFFPLPVVYGVGGVLRLQYGSPMMTIKGQNLTRGCQPVDYVVTVGGSVWQVVKLADDQLTVRVPSRRRRSAGDSATRNCSNGTDIVLSIGYSSFFYGCLEFFTPTTTTTTMTPTTSTTSSTPIPLIVGLVVGLGGALLILLVVLIVVLAVKSSSRRRRQKEDSSKFSRAVGGGYDDSIGVDGYSNLTYECPSDLTEPVVAYSNPKRDNADEKSAAAGSTSGLDTVTSRTSGVSGTFTFASLNCDHSQDKPDETISMKF